MTDNLMGPPYLFALQLAAPAAQDVRDGSVFRFGCDFEVRDGPGDGGSGGAGQRRRRRQEDRGRRRLR